jgi:hypothetical protein
MKLSLKGISKNSDFFVKASGPTFRKHRADDCTDAAVRRSEDRTMHGAIVENRSVRVVHEDRRGGLPWGWRTSTELPKVGALRRRRNRGESAFLEVPLTCS